MVNNVTPIRKYVKLKHGSVLDLYKVGTESVLSKIEKLDSRRALAIGGLLGGLGGVLILLVGSWVSAMF